MRLKHKFNATPCFYKGIRFASKLERNVFLYLERLKKAKVISMILRQVPFHLPGGVTYRVDFQVFWANGSVEHIDAKGMETKEFIMKKKMVEDLYPVEITVWKKVPL